MTMVTNPACGIPAAPILAAVAVMEMAMIWPILMVICLTWEMKMAATASYNAVPSMLMVAPMGRTNLKLDWEDMNAALDYSAHRWLT